jgi:subtilisin family serine protease
MALKLGTKVIDALLLGPESRRRQLQDFPILGDVWTRFAGEPGKPADLLIVPSRDKPAAAVAQIVEERAAAHNDDPTNPRSVAYLHNLVVASLSLADLEEVVFPATHWWDQIQDRWNMTSAPTVAELTQWITDELRGTVGAQAAQSLDFGELPALDEHSRIDTDNLHAAKLGLLLGVFLCAAKHGAEAEDPATAAEAGVQDLGKSPQESLADVARRLTPLAIVREGTRAVERVMARHAEFSREANDAGEPWNGVIFHVTLNRDAQPALSESVPAIKADAARTLFSISCAQVAWAVLDSGIDHDHLAFRDHAQAKKRIDRTKALAAKASAGAPGEPEDASEPTLEWYPHRIRATFDFTRIRAILGVQTGAQVAALVTEFEPDRKIPTDDIRKLLEAVREDKVKGRPLDWRKIQPLIELDSGERKGKPRLEKPKVPHGTHVAGILGADWIENGDVSKLCGVCPDILLYDCRVLGSDLGDSEFAVSAALQFLRFFNEQSGHPRVNGVNMSLAIRHNVRNYACGRTPVCIEAEALAANGVVVVAAAGNRGYQQYQLADSTTYEGYAASSITDPGNAEGVITVGSTHRHWPHTYGVSFFSSRGPTGDGRMKPDLLAPGEKILSCVPGNREDQMDGTSMAAPHVSGAAALLMARHEELKGQPVRIKDILCSTATDLKRERSFQGHGMVDVLRAIQSI